MDPFLGVGFSLHADLEYLELSRTILEDEADYFEVNPEAMWRKVDGRLERNDFRELFRQIKEASGKPFVAHGLALSLGSGLDEHGEQDRFDLWLERIGDDHATFEFEWMSEHLGWIQCDGLQTVLPLPLPFDQASVDLVAERLRRLSEIVPVVAFENSANYFLFGSAADEPPFLNALLHQTQCRLMLDLHNVHTQAVNMGFDPFAYVDAIDLERVVQIHLSGGSESDPEWLSSGRIMRLDSHDGPIPEPVWDLLTHVLPGCTGLRGILVERLNGTFGPEDVPDLTEEVRRARNVAHLRGTSPRSVALRDDVPPGPDSGDLRRWLTDVFTGPAPQSRLAEPPDALSKALGDVDEDGFVLTALIVRKLRFERLCMGDSRMEQWFDADPEGFASTFNTYERDVPPTVYFPNEEATTFHAWRKDREIALPDSIAD